MREFERPRRQGGLIQNGQDARIARPAPGAGIDGGTPPRQRCRAEGSKRASFLPPRKWAPLDKADRFPRLVKSRPHLHFDKSNRVTAPRHDIDLAASDLVTSQNA